MVLIGLVLGSTGCQSDDHPSGVSERPWNQPKGWENGLPQEMFEGR
jgi:hypothetical protein